MKINRDVFLGCLIYGIDKTNGSENKFLTFILNLINLGYVMISVTTIWIYHMWMKLKYERKPVKSLVLSTFAVLLFQKPT